MLGRCGQCSIRSGSPGQEQTAPTVESPLNCAHALAIRAQSAISPAQWLGLLAGLTLGAAGTAGVNSTPLAGKGVICVGGRIRVRQTMLVAGTVVAVVFFWWVALGPLTWLIAGDTVRTISDAKDRAAH